MSRIGKIPVPIPAGVKIEKAGKTVKVKGPKGELAIELQGGIDLAVEGAQVRLTRPDDQRRSKALHGLSRALVKNMLQGVSAGFERKLEIHGVGYGAKLEGRQIALTVGYSKPAKLPIPTGVEVKLADATHIAVQGIDIQKVGHFAAVIRAVRKPEPYKQTGIRYEGEVVRKKAGKKFGSGGG